MMTAKKMTQLNAYNSYSKWGFLSSEIYSQNILFDWIMFSRQGQTVRKLEDTFISDVNIKVEQNIVWEFIIICVIFKSQNVSYYIFPKKTRMIFKEELKFLVITCILFCHKPGSIYFLGTEWPGGLVHITY